MIPNRKNRLPSKYSSEHPPVDSSLKENQPQNQMAKGQFQMTFFNRSLFSRVNSNTKQGLLSPNPIYNGKTTGRQFQFKDPLVAKGCSREKQQLKKKESVERSHLEVKLKTREDKSIHDMPRRDDLPAAPKSNNRREVRRSESIANQKPQLLVVGSAATISASPSIPQMQNTFYCPGNQNHLRPTRSKDTNKSTKFGETQKVAIPVPNAYDRAPNQYRGYHTQYNNNVSGAVVRPIPAQNLHRQINPYFLSMGKMEIETEEDPAPADVRAYAQLPTYCVIYVCKIVSHLFNKENSQLQCGKFISQVSTQLPDNLRVALYDELIGLASSFKLRERSLFLAFELIELYMSTHTIDLENVRILSRACLFLVSKYEEIYPPKIASFLNKLNAAVTKDHLLSYESEVLGLIQFDMSRVIPLDFFNLFLCVAEFDHTVTNIGLFVLTLCALEHSFYSCSYSLIAFGLCYFLHKHFRTAPFYELKSAPDGPTFVLTINKGKFDPDMAARLQGRVPFETLRPAKDIFIFSFNQKNVKSVYDGILILTQRFRENDCPNLFSKFHDESTGCFSATNGAGRGQ